MIEYVIGSNTWTVTIDNTVHGPQMAWVLNFIIKRCDVSPGMGINRSVAKGIPTTTSPVEMGSIVRHPLAVATVRLAGTNLIYHRSRVLPFERESL